jgi:hypothetical protein
MKRLLRLCVALVMLTAACGSSESDGYDVADRVLESLGQPTGPLDPTDTDGCFVLVQVDEYGFKNETVTCPRGFTSVPLPDTASEAQEVEALQFVRATSDLPLWVYDQFVAKVPEVAESSFEGITSSLEGLDASCGANLDEWISVLAVIADQATELSNLIELGRLDGWVGTNEARALSRALMERALLQTNCARPAGGSPVPADQLADGRILGVTSRAALGLSELARLLTDESSGYLFHFFTPEQNYEWLRTQTENVDLIVYGTSQAGAGIDVPILASELGVRAGNASLAGSLADVQQHWFVEVERYIDPDTVVWLVGAIDLLIDCPPIGREQQFIDRVNHRARTFAASGWFSDVDPTNVVLGPVGPPNTNMGNGIKQSEPSQKAIDGHLALYEDRFATAEFCEGRAATIASSIQRMTQDGRRVVIVGMPLSDIGYERLSGGVEAAASALSRLESEFLTGLGADVIDMTSVLSDRVDLWFDYTHFTESGSKEFTELLVKQLKQRGL